MKNRFIDKKISLILALSLTAALFSGCAQQDSSTGTSGNAVPAAEQEAPGEDSPAPEAMAQEETGRSFQDMSFEEVNNVISKNEIYRMFPTAVPETIEEYCEAKEYVRKKYEGLPENDQIPFDSHHLTYQYFKVDDVKTVKGAVLWEKDSEAYSNDTILEEVGDKGDLKISSGEDIVALYGTLYELYRNDKPCYDMLYYPGQDLPEGYEVRTTEDYKINTDSGRNSYAIYSELCSPHIEAGEICPGAYLTFEKDSFYREDNGAINSFDGITPLKDAIYDIFSRYTKADYYDTVPLYSVDGTQVISKPAIPMDEAVCYKDPYSGDVYIEGQWENDGSGFKRVEKTSWTEYGENARKNIAGHQYMIYVMPATLNDDGTMGYDWSE